MLARAGGGAGLVALAAVLLAMVTAGGCAARKSLYVQEFVAAPYGKVGSVAVLPFRNKSGYKQGDRILYRVFLSELVMHGPWRVALEGDVRKIYQQLHLKPWDQPSPEQLKVIASRLGVERLIAGDLFAMEEKIYKDYVNPSISLQLRIYDGETGRILLATDHRRQGDDYRTMMHFGLVNSVTNLSRRLVQEILSEWRQRGLIACEG
ncbi:MAG: hypothetical protein ACOY8P_08710 [Thermodesulfobacteriota bacterium]|jgi:hypothetical protein